MGRRLFQTEIGHRIFQKRSFSRMRLGYAHELQNSWVDGSRELATRRRFWLFWESSHEYADLVTIALYGHDGQIRELNLRPGKVNVLTGSSKTGKSALIQVVDYCMGASGSEIPAGIIRKAVSWFALKLQLSGGQAVVARRCPVPGSSTSEEVFVSIANSVNLPDHSQLHQTTNIDGLRYLLTAWCGIAENMAEPALGQSRPALSANIRHAILFCLQPQDEIIRRDQLFHDTSDFCRAISKGFVPVLSWRGGKRLRAEAPGTEAYKRSATQHREKTD